MWKAAGNSGERFIAFSFAVIALATVFFTPVCLAQDPTTGNPVSGNLVLVTGSTPIGTQLLDNAGSLSRPVRARSSWRAQARLPCHSQPTPGLGLLRITIPQAHLTRMSRYRAFNM